MPVVTNFDSIFFYKSESKLMFEITSLFFAFVLLLLLTFRLCFTERITGGSLKW